MKTVLIVFILLASVKIPYAQKIEKFYDYNWNPVEDPLKARFYALIQKKDSLWTREDYYIREKKLQMQGSYKDQECKIEHGSFSFYHANGMLDKEGGYINGKKNGLWLSYHDNGMMSDSVVYDFNGWVMGTRLGWHANGYPSDSTVIYPDGSGLSIWWFDNGLPSTAGRYGPGHKLHGKWQYFHRNGQLSSLETYENGVRVNKEYYDENGALQNDTTNGDRPSSFPGGNSAWKKYLEKQLYFPSQYRITNGDQAVVVVGWTVDEEGNVMDVRITTSFHPDFDEIALKAVRKSPKWIPGISHNRKARQYNQQPITFSQTEN